MKRIVLDVRSGKDPETAVFPVGVDQVVHQEDLGRNLLETERMRPCRPVEMPEQPGTARRLADHEPGGKPDIGKSHLLQNSGGQFLVCFHFLTY